MSSPDYSKLLSPKVCALKKSGIRKFFDLLDTMEGVVGLTVGQPDFTTPWHIREAAETSIDEGKTYYTSNAGLPRLRDAIAGYLDRRFGLRYTQSEIITTVGGSEAIDLAVRAIVSPGDEVIVPEPSFVCYKPLVVMAGGIPVTVTTRVEDSFKLTPGALEAAITDRTKAVILTFPNNPTGAIMTKEDLEGIAGVLRDRDIAVISDEIYAELTYGRRHASIASIHGMRERTVIASGFSKAYAMTGWRLGYIAAPEPFIEQMLKIHQYVIMSASTPSQYAGLEAALHGDADIDYMREQYNYRRRYIRKRLSDIGLESFEPEGAFYIYPYIGGFGLSSDDFCNRLLYENACAIIPGTAFGDAGEGFARLSYAYSVKHIDTALDRIGDFVEKLKREKGL